MVSVSTIIWQIIGGTKVKRVVIEESKRGPWKPDNALSSVPGMLLSPKRLITYVYPLLLNTIVHIYTRNRLSKDTYQ